MRKSINSLSLVFLLFFLASTVRAGQTAYTKDSIFGEPYKVVVDGREANKSIWKGYLEISELMKADPVAFDLAKKYETYAKISYGASIGLALGAVAFSSITNRNNHNSTIFYSMIGGSLIASIVGRPFANRYLKKAVDAYNKNETALGFSDFEVSVAPIVASGGLLAIGCTF